MSRTCHIWGSNSPMVSNIVLVSQLCNSGRRTVEDAEDCAEQVARDFEAQLTLDAF
eukprot:SAG31_NODE_2935_length_4895_cov_5.362177_8_plen_55_part_01